MKRQVLIIFTLIAFVTEISLLCFSVAASSQILIEKNYAGISYITGGIGFDERKEFRRVRSEYSLRLVFAVKSGAYLSDVEVLIQDKNNKKIFEGVSDGPWFYVKLPEGSYTVKATMQGMTLKENVAVSDKGREVGFHWD